MRSIDLNGDLGESYGRWRLMEDDALLASLSSVNLACGFHAGDPSGLRRAVRAAVEHRLAIGAHPSYPDLRGFGRTPMALPPEAVRDDVIYQLGALHAICRAEGATLRHVKPHGALYHAVSGDAATATAVADAIAAFDPGLPLMVAANAPTLPLLEDHGVVVLREAFLDRGYGADGRLLPRDRHGATIEDVFEVAERAVHLSTEGWVADANGQRLQLDPHTLCLHGDGANVLRLARAVREALDGAGVRVRPAVEELA